MMTSWWAAGEVCHYVQTHQPSMAIFWAQEEKPAVKLVDYCKTLYDRQRPWIQEVYPLVVPTDRQAYNRLEWKEGGTVLALPGKDPDKIRSEHPTIVVFDEAAHIERGAEAFGVAVLTRVPKLLGISTAAPSWYRDITRDALPIPLPVLQGITA
jgi:hypothetical protein